MFSRGMKRDHRYEMGQRTFLQITTFTNHCTFVNIKRIKKRGAFEVKIKASQTRKRKTSRLGKS